MLPFACCNKYAVLSQLEACTSHTPAHFSPGAAQIERQSSETDLTASAIPSHAIPNHMKWASQVEIYQLYIPMSCPMAMHRSIYGWPKKRFEFPLIREILYVELLLQI